MLISHTNKTLLSILSKASFYNLNYKINENLIEHIMRYLQMKNENLFNEILKYIL